MAPSKSPMIRPLTLSDEAEWRRLWQAYLAFYDTDLPEAVYATTFGRLISDDPVLNGLIAESDGKASGLVHYIFHGHCWRPEGTCYLQDLYVDPQTRGRGTGRALIQAVYDAADARGVSSVYWLTQEFNYKGRMLYDQMAARTPFIHYRRPS